MRPSLKETPPAVSPPPAQTVAAAPAISADPFEDLRQRHLTLPVEGIKRKTCATPSTRCAAARAAMKRIDVLAPRNTPVLAVEDGKIAKLVL